MKREDGLSVVGWVVLGGTRLMGLPGHVQGWGALGELGLCEIGVLVGMGQGWGTLWDRVSAESGHTGGWGKCEDELHMGSESTGETRRALER